MHNVEALENPNDDVMSEFGDIVYLASSVRSINSARHYQTKEAELKKVSFHEADEKLINSEPNKNQAKIDDDQEENAIVIDSWHKSFDRCITPYKGYIYIVLSVFVYSFTQMLLKKAYTLNGIDNSLIRYFIQIFVMLAITRYKHLNPLGPKKNRKLLCLRGIFGMMGLTSYYCALSFINPSDTTALTHSSLIITAILARIFLKEMLSIAHLIALVLTLVGVACISKPSFIFPKAPTHLGNLNSSLSLNYNFTQQLNSTFSNIQSDENTLSMSIGVTFALCGALGTGVVFIVLKKLANHDIHYSVSNLYQAMVGLPLTFAGSGILILAGFSHKDIHKELALLPYHLFFSISASLLGMLAQTFLVLSLQYGDVNKV